MPKSRQIASRGIPRAPKIDLKSLPGAFRASLGAREAPRDHPERSRHAPGSSCDHPGSVPGAPGESPSPAQGARKSARERFGAAKIDAEAPTGAKRASFCVRRACAPFTERLFDDFCRFSDFSQNAETLQCTAPASQNQGSTLRAVRLSARAMRP